MRTEQVKVYQFDELSDEAKEKAREWWRNCTDSFDFEAEYVIEDAATIAELMGIDLRQRPVTLMSGKIKTEPSIYWDSLEGGGWVTFDAYYKYKKGSVKAVKEHAPEDKELHRIVEELQRVQKKHFYKLEANCNYHHYYGMRIEVMHEEDIYRDIGDAERDIKEVLKDFAHWIYKRLQEALEWTYSEENVDEAIRCNEYEFTEEGERWVRRRQ